MQRYYLCTQNQKYYILNHMESIQTQLPFISKKPIFKRINDIAEIAKMPSEEREKYQRSLDAYRTNAATYVYEREQGRAEGREEGRAEERITNARKMIAAGMPEDLVLSTLGLSKEDLLK